MTKLSLSILSFLLGLSIGYFVGYAQPVATLTIPEEEDQGPAQTYLENHGYFPCELTFWNDLSDAQSTWSSKNDLNLPLRDVAVVTCSHVMSGETITLAAERPDGLGQTNEWYVVYENYNLPLVQIPFETTLSLTNTDDTPQCSFDVGSNPPTEEQAIMPTQFHVICHAYDLQTYQPTEQRFLIDLSAKTASLVTE